MQDSLPAGGLRLYREGVEPSGSLRKVSGYISVLLSRTSPVARAEYVKKHDLTENVLYGEEFSTFLAGVQSEFSRILKAKGIIQ